MAEENKEIKVEEVAEEKAEEKAEDVNKADSVSGEEKNEKADNITDKDSEKAEEKEALDDSEIVDINAKENVLSDEKESKKNVSVVGGKKAPKTTEDFIAKQKRRKGTKRIVVFLLIVAAIIAVVLFLKNRNDKAREAMTAMQANSIQTSKVEKKTLYDSKDATGTLYALESRTISRSLQGTGSGGAKIDAINVEVGDHVNVGDILVEFSSENVEKSIAEAKEDIGTQKQLDAINAEDAQRSYVYSYNNAATSMESAAKSVDRALKALYEACDAYGDAKRARDEAKKQAEEDGKDWDSIKGSYESAVNQAYQTEQQAQKTYDDAVASQANGGQGSVAAVSNTLSEADSTYKKAQINSGENVKKLQRQLESSIDSLDDYVVYATIKGVVTDVNVSEGNTFVSGTVLTIQDDSGYKADVLVDEYDIPKVKKAYEQKKAQGQELEVVVRTDATGDTEYKGHVTKIAPTSTSTTTMSSSSSSGTGAAASSGASSSSSSTANYKVSIELDEIDEAFMIGMSAKVAIVVDESPENSLCVAYNCVEERDGKYYVRVMDENGDKSTAMPSGMSGKGGPGFPASNEEDADSDTSETKGVNGIVIEKESSSSEDKRPSGNRPGSGKSSGFLSSLFNFGKDDTSTQTDRGRRYREEEVEKLFETDYYVAIIPKTDGSIKEGDEVMVVSEKSNDNSISSMFGGGPGGGMGGGPGGGPGGF